jgi:ATP-dependent Clp protease ATP-binding subunit ClpX
MIHRHCSFCDATESDHNPLIAGTNVYICKKLCLFRVQNHVRRRR